MSASPELVRAPNARADVDVVSAPADSEAFAALVARQRPVVLARAAHAFRAFHRWSPEYLGSDPFLARLPLDLVDVSIHAEETATIADRDGEFRQLGLPLREAVRELVAGRPGSPRLYLTQCSVEKAPGLAADFTPPDYLPREGRLPMNFWIGRDTVSPIHYDLADNVLYQLVGEKRLVLFAPEAAPYLYMSRKRAGFVSPVNNAEAPDLERYPLFARAPRIEVDLRAGDALYLPRKWFHYVRSSGLSVAVNFWWVVNA